MLEVHTVEDPDGCAPGLGLSEAGVADGHIAVPVGCVYEQLDTRMFRKMSSFVD